MWNYTLSALSALMIGHDHSCRGAVYITAYNNTVPPGTHALYVPSNCMHAECFGRLTRKCIGDETAQDAAWRAADEVTGVRHVLNELLWAFPGSSLDKTSDDTDHTHPPSWSFVPRHDATIARIEHAMKDANNGHWSRAHIWVTERNV